MSWPKIDSHVLSAVHHKNKKYNEDLTYKSSFPDEAGLHCPSDNHALNLAGSFEVKQANHKTVQISSST